MTSTRTLPPQRTELNPKSLAPITSVFFQAVVILLAHGMVDFYAAAAPALLGVLETQCGLAEFQTATVLAVISLVGGLSQPLSAALNDRFGWNASGGIGLAISAMALCMLGRAHSFGTLIPIIGLGYLGVGIFHPIAASSMGQLRESWRSVSMSAFFVAGMVGGSLGSYLLPRWVVGSGLVRLESIILPGVVMAGMLHCCLRGLQRRPSKRHRPRPPENVNGNWYMVVVLYAVTTMRAGVYTTLMYLLLRWIQSMTAADHPEWEAQQIAEQAAPVVGGLIAKMVIGMGIGGLLAGMLIRPGVEKLPLIFVPVALAPSILLIPHLGLQFSGWLVFFAGIGFASMSPIALSLAQRLLPHRSNLASSLMLGGGWAVAGFGPALAEPAISRIGITPVFYIVAAVLCLSGLMAVFLKRDSLMASVVS